MSALEESIAHWERLATGNKLRNEGLGPYHCKLCRAFHSDYACFPSCDGCPVFDRTGKRYCVDTPFEDASKAESEFGLDSSEFRAAAQKELDFLKSLLPTSATISNQKDAE